MGNHKVDDFSARQSKIDPRFLEAFMILGRYRRTDTLHLMESVTLRLAINVLNRIGPLEGLTSAVLHFLQRA